MKDCEKILKILKVKFQVLIVSAHRTPKRMFDFAEKAEKNGFGVIVAGAGGAAHLAGMVASLTTLPVLGVPMETKKLKGLDSLTVSYTHLRAHETLMNLVCRLLLEKTHMAGS